MDGRNGFMFNVPESVPIDSLHVDEHVALWNGHEFEAVRYGAWRRVPARPNFAAGVAFKPGGFDGVADHYEVAMQVYYPIDPRIILSDIKGARRAYANESNTGWLFEHVDNDGICLLYTSPSPRDS